MNPSTLKWRTLFYFLCFNRSQAANIDSFVRKNAQNFG